AKGTPASQSQKVCPSRFIASNALNAVQTRAFWTSPTDSTHSGGICVLSQAEIPSDRRREERREAAHAYKRAEILAAARRVMTRVGAKGLTIRAVAAEAGYVPGAVYFYFHSKAAIISELAVQELSGLTKQLRAASPRDAADRAAAAAEAFAAAHTIFSLDA